MLGGAAVRVRKPSLLRAVGLEEESSNSSKDASRPLSFPKPSLLRAVGLKDESSNSSKDASRQLSFPKPSWVVRTESNVRKHIRKKPDPPCVVCRGSGRVHCHHCSGQGRTNEVQSTMLPKGEWPKWCTICGGSGLTYCSRCLGTGEYRYLMGFHFMNMNRNRNRVDDAHDKS
ncbi:hypothetical protein Q3G72_022763 [Acer saccharum]|nr:hypothetical protein Q3G72_022763 [Acer saccharum]